PLVPRHLPRADPGLPAGGRGAARRRTGPDDGARGEDALGLVPRERRPQLQLAARPRTGAGAAPRRRARARASRPPRPLAPVLGDRRTGRPGHTGETRVPPPPRRGDPVVRPEPCAR